MSKILFQSLIALASASTSLAVTYSFETSQDLADNFTLTSGEPALVAPGQGVGGSTALAWRSPGEEVGFFYRQNQKISVSPFSPAPVTVSLDFRLPFNLGSSIGNNFFVGFESPNAGNPLTRINATFSTNSGSTILALDLANNSALPLDSVFLNTGSLNTQNWMRLSLTYGLSVGFFGEGGPFYAFEYQYSLHDLGADGLAPASLIATDSGLLDYLNVPINFRDDITLATEWAPFFGLTNFSAQNFVYADNFTVVPEPSSAAALIGCFALGCAALRRRRR